MRDSRAVNILKGEAIKAEIEAQKYENNAATQTHYAQIKRKEAKELRDSLNVLKVVEGETK